MRVKFYTRRDDLDIVGVIAVVAKNVGATNFEKKAAPSRGLRSTNVPGLLPITDQK